MEEIKNLTLSEHLSELKRRLIYSLLTILIGFGISYFFSEEIYRFLLKPLSDVLEGQDRKMIYTGLAEAFLTYIKLALFAGIILSFPIVIYQIYSFIAPGLYKNEKHVFLSFIFAAPVLFLIGGAFVYYFLFPVAWDFFLSFETSGDLPVQLEARVSEYLSLVITLILAFGLSFQIPLILVLLMKVGLLHPETLKKGRRYAIVILLSIAGIITPPDIFSQVALFAPLYMLYELAIIVGRKMVQDV